MSFEFRDVLYMFVRNSIAIGPRCFRCLMFMPSAPVELLFLLFLIACMTCSDVIGMNVEFSLLVCLSMILFCVSVLYFVTLTNCWLKEDAILLGAVAVLPLNVIVLFGCCGGCLFDREFIVFHKMCVFCLWSQCSSSFDFHISDLCCEISWFISSLIVLMFLSFGFCCLRWSLLRILSLIGSGSSKVVVCSLPFGMWCLSAFSIAFVRILFAM